MKLERKLKVLIEHCENELSDWLWFEYENSSRIVGKQNIVFTNVKSTSALEKLRALGMVKRESVVELIESGELSPSEVIVLDPYATTLLSPQDFNRRINYVVIGGILGDYPPTGRTKLMITSKLDGCRARSLGPYQFSIDGAVYIALQVFKGKSIDQIPIQIGLKISLSDLHEVYLPYAYPLINGIPLISKNLIEYLKSQA